MHVREILTKCRAQAIERLKRALSADPTYADAMYNMGLFLQRLERHNAENMNEDAETRAQHDDNGTTQNLYWDC